MRFFNRNSFGECLLNISKVLLLIILLILVPQITFNVTRAQNSIVYGMPFWRFLVPAIFLGLAAVISMHLLPTHGVGHVRRKTLRNFSWLVWLLVQYVYIWGTYSVASSDCWVVHDFAFDFARNSNIFMWYVEYFAMYSNNILLGMVSFAIQKIVPLACEQDMWFLMSCLACLLADLAIYWTLKLIVHNFGEGYYFISFVALCLLVGLSEEATILYSDILSLWTIPFAAYHIGVASATEGKSKTVMYIKAGAALGFGGSIKPQILIFLIAWLIVSLIRYFIQRNAATEMRAILVGVLVCVMVCTGWSYVGKLWYCSNVAPRYEEYPQEYLRDNNFPTLHWVNMGLNRDSLGGYSAEDVEFTKGIIGKENKSVALKWSIKQRLSDFGLLGYLRFVNEKMRWALQNGSFSEGIVWKGTCINEGYLAQKVQSIFVSTSENWKYGIAVFVQTTYLLCLWTSIWNVIRDLTEKNNITIVEIAQVTLLGDLLFLALFERNMRYFFSVVPLLIFLAIAGLHRLSKRK